MVDVVGVGNVLVVVALAYGTLVGFLVHDELLELVHLLLLGLLIQIAQHELLLLLLLLFPLVLLLESSSLLQLLPRFRSYLLTLTRFPSRLRFGLRSHILDIQLHLSLPLSYKFVLRLLVLSHSAKLLFILLGHPYT